MGRWWYEWTECNEQLAYKKCENKRKYRIPKRVFDFYKSANEHTKAPRKIPPVIFLAIGAALICAYMLFSAFYKPATQLLVDVVALTGSPCDATTPLQR